MENVIGKNIRLLRKQRKISQQDLADALYMTQQAVAAWECGQAVPPVERIMDLAKFFQVPIHELVCDRYRKCFQIPINKTDEIISKIKGLRERIKTSGSLVDSLYADALQSGIDMDSEKTGPSGTYVIQFYCTEREYYLWLSLKELFPDYDTRAFVTLIRQMREQEKYK